MNTLIDERQGSESREEIEKGIENSGSEKSRSRQVDHQLSDGKAYLETTELKPVRYVQSCRHCRKLSTLLACILHSARMTTFRNISTDAHKRSQPPYITTSQ
jgi:hypothetical protein